MARRPLRPKDVQDPERILGNLLKDYAEGRLDGHRVIYRASVVQIDNVGGQLETDPPNPRGSIKARIITDAYDAYTSIEDLGVFWPLFPFDLLPVKESEHVYVIFEDPNKKDHGLWITRIPEPNNVDNPNLTPGLRKFEQNSANEMGSSPEKAVQDTVIDPGIAEVSPEFPVNENITGFRARVGDRVIQGSHNTLVVLGRDRPTNAESGETADAGTIDIVAGRVAGSADVDPAADKSRIYLTMNSDVDGNFNIQVGEAAGPSAAIVLKSDQIRVVARNGMKLVVEGGDITLDAQTIILGNQATEAAVLGNKLVADLGRIIDAIVAGPVGALGTVPVPTNPAVVTQLNTIKSALQTNILSTVNKVK